MRYGILLALLAAVFWGVSPIFQKRALREAGLLELNAMRGLGALAVILPALFFAKPDVLLPGIGSYLIVVAVVFVNNLIGDVLAFIAIRNIGASLATPITNAYPLAIAVISWLWFGEKLTYFVLAGTFLVVTGLALLNLRGKAKTDSQPGRYLYGVASAIIAALCWAFGLSLNKYLTLQGVTSTAIIFWRGTIFSFMAWGNYAIFRTTHPNNTRRLKDISLTGKAASILAGAFSLVLGAWCYTTSVTLIPMNVATPTATSSPLITALIACLFMGERLRLVQWLGIVVVVVGAVVVSS
ncbi:membrane protein [Synergistales bacterium]|nr:membrane protein [Synergistales bacterium]